MGLFPRVWERQSSKQRSLQPAKAASVQQHRGFSCSLQSTKSTRVRTQQLLPFPLTHFGYIWTPLPPPNSTLRCDSKPFLDRPVITSIIRVSGRLYSRQNQEIPLNGRPDSHLFERAASCAFFCIHPHNSAQPRFSC